MSQGNIEYELKNGIFATVGNTSVAANSAGNTVGVEKVINVPNNSPNQGRLCILGYCGDAPGTYAVASEGYTADFALGCIMIDVGNGIAYSNNGGAISTPAWTVLS